jgi:hypothetical protein
MKSIRSYQILRDITETVAILEYSRQSLVKSTNAEKVINAVQGDPHFRKFLSHKRDEEIDVNAIVEELLNIIEDLDKTPNKKYTAAVFNLYLKGGRYALVEDLQTKVFDTIEILNEAKRLNLIDDNRETDIPFYKSIADLYTAGLKYDELVKYELSIRKQKQVEEESSDKGTYKVIYEDKEIRVVQIFDFQAACFFGRGTRWCTQSEGNYNLYSRYGPQFILYPKKPRVYDTTSRTGKAVIGTERYQITVGVTKLSDGRYLKGHSSLDYIYTADEVDYDVPFSELVKRYPTVVNALKVPSVLGQAYLQYDVSKNSPDVILAIKNETLENLKEALSLRKFETLGSIYKDAESSVITAIEQSPYSFDEILKILIDLIDDEIESENIVSQLSEPTPPLATVDYIPVKAIVNVTVRFKKFNLSKDNIVPFKDYRGLNDFLRSRLPGRVAFNQTKNRYTFE